MELMCKQNGFLADETAMARRETNNWFRRNFNANQSTWIMIPKCNPRGAWSNHMLSTWWHLFNYWNRWTPSQQHESHSTACIRRDHREDELKSLYLSVVLCFCYFSLFIDDSIINEYHTNISILYSWIHKKCFLDKNQAGKISLNVNIGGRIVLDLKAISSDILYTTLSLALDSHVICVFTFAFICFCFGLQLEIQDRYL